MKKLSYLLSGFVLVALLVASGCGDDDPGGQPAGDVVGQRLDATWTIDATQGNQVVFASEDRTTDYSTFTLDLSYTVGQNRGSYTINGGPVGDRPFASTSGTWEFTNEITDPNATSFQITRSDGVTIQVTTLTDSALSFTFSYDNNNSGSRTNNLVGQWTFNMVQ